MTPDNDLIILHLKAHNRGADRAISAPELAAEFHTTDRQIRARIRHLRLCHTLIGGDPEHGFYWPRTRVEASRTLLSLRSRQSAIKEVADAYEVAVDIEFGNQMVLEEVL